MDDLGENAISRKEVLKFMSILHLGEQTQLQFTKWKTPLIFPRKYLFTVHLTEKYKIEFAQNLPLVRNKKTISRFHGHIKVLYIFQTGIFDKINSAILKKNLTI